MTHRLDILIAIHISIVASCTAMELPSIKNPQQALFLTNDHVIISHKHGCTIIDIKTNKEIIKLNKKSFPHLALHPNKKKVAITHDNSVKIYTTKTGQLEWNVKKSLIHTPVASSIFSPLSDDTIFMSYQCVPIIIKYTYPQNRFCILGSSQLRLFQQNPPTIAFHPTKPHTCSAYNPGKISIFNEETFETKTILPITDMHPFCEYSPNGSYIAVGNQHDILILDSYTETEISDYSQSIEMFSLSKKDKDQFLTMTFHPNSAILATLSNHNGIVHYWDVATRKPIIELPPLHINATKIYKGKRPCLSFSPHGKDLIITFKNNCYMMPVPFEAIYQADAKNIAPFVCWIFKNYLFDADNMLPHDITRLLVYTLLETLKR